MKIKKLILCFLVLVLAFSLIAASGVVTKTAKIRAGEDKTVAIGRLGFHFADSYYSGSIKVSARTEDPAAKGYRKEFTQKLADVRFTDLDGNRITKITGGVYVFYKLRRYEVNLWKKNQLGIFYFDPWHNTWKECNSFAVNGDDSRISCRILNFGLYGLARK